MKLLLFLLCFSTSVKALTLSGDISPHEKNKIKEIHTKILQIFEIKPKNKKLFIHIKGHYWGPHMSNFSAPNKIEVGRFMGEKLNYQVVAHEIVHWVIYNFFRDYKSLNNAFLRESLPDLIGSLFSSSKKMICEKVMDRTFYPQLSYQSPLNQFQTYYYRKKALACCYNNDDLFCAGLKKKIRDNINYLKKYPASWDNMSSHLKGIPIYNFFFYGKFNFGEIKKFVFLLKKYKNKTPQYVLKKFYKKDSHWKKYFLGL